MRDYSGKGHDRVLREAGEIPDQLFTSNITLDSIMLASNPWFLIYKRGIIKRLSKIFLRALSTPLFIKW